MYYVYVNFRKKRIYVGKRAQKGGWALWGEYPTFLRAMRVARCLADFHDFILEWDSPSCNT